jgi:hypothetical protein
MHATCATHLILYFITLIISGYEYKFKEHTHSMLQKNIQSMEVKSIYSQDLEDDWTYTVLSIV